MIWVTGKPQTTDSKIVNGNLLKLFFGDLFSDLIGHLNCMSGLLLIDWSAEYLLYRIRLHPWTVVGKCWFPTCSQPDILDLLKGTALLPLDDYMLMFASPESTCPAMFLSFKRSESMQFHPALAPKLCCHYNTLPLSRLCCHYNTLPLSRLYCHYNTLPLSRLCCHYNTLPLFLPWLLLTACASQYSHALWADSFHSSAGLKQLAVTREIKCLAPSVQVLSFQGQSVSQAGELSHFCLSLVLKEHISSDYNNQCQLWKFVTKPSLYPDVLFNFKGLDWLFCRAL